MKKILNLLLVLTLAVSLVACGNKGGATDDTSKVLHSNGGPEEFFEAPWLNPGSFFYNKVLYSRLIVADENLSPLENDEDALAKSYTFSDDGTQLSFELRDDIYWHDGEAITAEDVKWSIEYASKTTVLNAVFKTTFDAIKGSDSEEFEGITVDGNKVNIEFADIAPDALLTFTQFAPLPQHLLKDVDPLQFQQSDFFQSPVGSGPFMLDEVKMNDFTTMKAFDKYYNGVAEFSIQLTPSPGDSDSNLVKNAMNGAIDFAYTKDVSDVKSLESTDGVTLTPVNVRFTRIMYPNKYDKKDGTKSPVSDARVRQAIRYAIDMDSVGESLFDGSVIPANSLIPGETDKAEGLNDYKFDPEKAKELLADAGWDSNYELDVVYYYTDQVTIDFLTTIQSYLADVGMKMNFRLLEGDLASLLWTAPSDPKNGPSAVDWDIAYAGIAALSLHEYYDRFASTSIMNSHTPYNETLEQLIKDTNASIVFEEQLDAFKELTKYENEDLFVLPLYYQPIYVVTSDRIKDSIDLTKLGNPQFNYNWNIQNWEIK